MSKSADREVVVAAVQMDVIQGLPARNSAVMAERLSAAAESGARLVVFPECAHNGYVFGGAGEARDAAAPPGHGWMRHLEAACAAHDVWVVAGFLERFDDRLHNSAAVIGPSGLLGIYRKTHLPLLGVDRYVHAGEEIPVFDLPFCRLGVLICYDIRFPEACRTLALKGADVLAVPTNWHQGAESAPEFLTRTRAWENRIWVVACNRVGTERGVRFIGRSQIVSPAGRVLAEAGGNEPETIAAAIVPAEARCKRLVVAPGEFEMDPIGDRRPEIYTV
ncbi:MAG: carbon-nitrogen hydrolase family protein [Armatimonadetes bacterium]|nr:carbon-nitrogen hydrolase family protein [Armatimonadota bacterium]MDE2207934.1 carbon-nitrogen hydrolase family protein [Armatimonadota bacterium]